MKMTYKSVQLVLMKRHPHIHSFLMKLKIMDLFSPNTLKSCSIKGVSIFLS